MEENKSKGGWRKVIFSSIFGFLVIGLSAVMVFAKIDVTDNFVKICGIVYLGYLASNLGSKCIISLLELIMKIKTGQK